MLRELKSSWGELRHQHHKPLPASSSAAGPPRLLLEAFEWYSPADGQHWARLREALPRLAHLGVTHLWLPPGCKASHQESNGYDAYDLWDLGEFDQKGHRATKWGPKEDLLALCRDAQSHHIGLLWDAVLSHKAAGDYTQLVQAVQVHEENRLKVKGEPREIEAWLGFNFDGRHDQYSAFKWNECHFNGTDWDQRTQQRTIYKLLGAGEKDWAQDVDREKGNFDYLLCHNVDLARDDVRDEYARWVDWLGHELGLSGLRYDAAKHMSQAFIKDHVERLDRQGKQGWWLIGEYCTGNVDVLEAYIDRMQGRIMLFDFPLSGQMQRLSRQSQPDLRHLFQGSLLSRRPNSTVTFVHNHDNQDRDDQPVQTSVDPGLIPGAYAMILLSDQGHPQVFWGDLYGVQGPAGPRPPSCNGKLPRLLLARKLYAHGPERRYLDSKATAGLTREGAPTVSGGAGVAVAFNVGNSASSKRMQVGAQHAGERWTDVYGAAGTVEIDKRGVASFPVGARSLSMWISSTAQGRADVEQAAA